MLVLCLKQLSKHLCGLCLTTKHQVYQLGTVFDMKRHKTKAREDSDDILDKIMRARRLIFEAGYSCDSDCVNDILAGESLLPIQVCFNR